MQPKMRTKSAPFLATNCPWFRFSCRETSVMASTTTFCGWKLISGGRENRVLPSRKNCWTNFSQISKGKTFCVKTKSKKWIPVLIFGLYLSVYLSLDCQRVTGGFSPRELDSLSKKANMTPREEQGKNLSCHKVFWRDQTMMDVH